MGLDYIGIGIGPFNLSLAALTKPEISALFIEQKPEISWHKGQMFPFSSLTVSFLKDLVSLVDPTGFSVNQDFSIQWDGPSSNKIFIQSAARKTHGIADPYFSLMAWRSAKILNAIAGKQIYDVSQQHTLLHWQ